MKNICNLLLLLQIIFHVSCTYDSVDLPEPTLNQDTTLSYMNHIKPIITTYCYGSGNQRCHIDNTNQGAVGNFTTYAGLKAKVDNGTIQSRVINPSGGMPPSYSQGPRFLTLDEKMKLSMWMDNGAPDN